MDEIKNALVILRRKQVEARTGLGKSTLYDYMRAGKFPRAMELGSCRAVGWLASEVDAWIAAQAAKRS